MLLTPLCLLKLLEFDSTLPLHSRTTFPTAHQYTRLVQRGLSLLYLKTVTQVSLDIYTWCSCLSLHQSICSLSSKFQHKLCFSRKLSLTFLVTYFCLLRGTLEAAPDSLPFKFFKYLNITWPVWLIWLEHCPTNWKVTGSVPGQGTCLGCMFIPSWCT